MNKKFLLKTLLPITSVVLIGGGIATSLVLSSCSKKVVLTSYMQVIEYLAKNAVILPSGSYTYDDVEGVYEIVEYQRATFFDSILPVFNKQSYINGVIAYICYGAQNPWDSDAKITIAIENNKIDFTIENDWTDAVINTFRLVIDASKFHSLNKYEIDTTAYINGDSVLNNPYIWDSSKSTDIQYAIENDRVDDACWYLTLIDVDGKLESVPFYISPIDVSAIKFSPSLD